MTSEQIKLHQQPRYWPVLTVFLQKIPYPGLKELTEQWPQSMNITVKILYLETDKLHYSGPKREQGAVSIWRSHFMSTGIPIIDTGIPIIDIGIPITGTGIPNIKIRLSYEHLITGTFCLERWSEYWNGSSCRAIKQASRPVSTYIKTVFPCMKKR